MSLNQGLSASQFKATGNLPSCFRPPSALSSTPMFPLSMPFHQHTHSPLQSHDLSPSMPRPRRLHLLHTLAASISMNSSPSSFSAFGSNVTAEAQSKAVVPAAMKGRWMKDKKVSDSMSEAINIMELSGLVRQAVKLIRGLHIDADESTFTLQVLSVLSWFKVTERFPLDGTVVQQRRRDLRKGKASCNLLPQQPGPHGGILLNLAWGEPHSGTGQDEFLVVPSGTAAAEKQGVKLTRSPGKEGQEDHELHVYSHLTATNGSASYRTVYQPTPSYPVNVT